MLKVYCETMSEYNEVKKRLKGMDANIKLPEDSFANTSWSIEEIKHHFPQDTPNEQLIVALKAIERHILGATQETGSEIIAYNISEMNETVNEKFNTSYKE